MRKNKNKSNRRRQGARSGGGGAFKGKALAMARRAAYPLGVLAVAIGVPLAAHGTYVFCVSSPYFALENIEVVGAARSTSADVARVAGLSPGINIFDLDPDEVAERAESHPWVKSASAERTLPRSLSVTVVEHEPAAILLDEKGWSIADAEGGVIKRLDESDPVNELLATLPLITGIDAGRLGAEGAAGESAKQDFVDAFDAMLAYYDRGLDRYSPISEAHVDPSVGVTLVLVQDGTRIQLGRGRWAERMERFEVVYSSVHERGVALDYVLVDHEHEIDRVAVKPRRVTQ